MSSRDRWPGRTHRAGSFAPRRSVSLLYPISDFPGSANAETMHPLYSRALELQPNGLGMPRTWLRKDKQAPFTVHEEVGTPGRPERVSREHWRLLQPAR